MQNPARFDNARVRDQKMLPLGQARQEGIDTLDDVLKPFPAWYLVPCDIVSPGIDLCLIDI